MNDNEFEGLNTPNGSNQIYKDSLKSHQKNEAEEIFGSWHLYVLILGILVLNISVLLFVRHRMKSQMREQLNHNVNSAVSQYF